MNTGGTKTRTQWREYDAIQATSKKLHNEGVGAAAWDDIQEMNEVDFGKLVAFGRYNFSGEKRNVCTRHWENFATIFVERFSIILLQITVGKL